MTPAPTKPRLAQELLQGVPLSDAAQALLEPTLTIRQFLERITAAQLQVDAIRVLAAGLPKPEAVWWGVLCVRQYLPKPWRVVCETACVAAEKWVKEPSDANRRAAGAAAEKAGWDTPTGCLAGAAWLSGGSLSPPELPAVLPREDLTGRTIAGVLLMLLALDPKQTDVIRASILHIGQQISKGEIKNGETPKE